MVITGRRILPAVMSAALLLAGATGTLAATPRAAVHPSHAKMDKLSISITMTNGTVWGKVTASYKKGAQHGSKSCSASSCQLRIPNGATLRLKQTAMDSSTWPFKDWQIRSSHGTKTVMGASATTKMTGALTVTAVYILHQSQSQSPSPSQPGYPYP